MKSRPPKKLTPEAARAASVFIDAAGAPDAGGAGPEVGAPGPPLEPSRRDGVGPARPAGEGGWPWEAPHVRDDVTKGYALRLPEPLYLRLKWVAEQTGRSINGLCRDAVEAEVARYFEGR